MKFAWLLLCSMNTGLAFNNPYAGLAVWFAGMFFMWGQE